MGVRAREVHEDWDEGGERGQALGCTPVQTALDHAMPRCSSDFALG